MSYRCWTCGNDVEAQVVARCSRPHCTAKRELAKDQTADERKRWAAEREEEARMKANPAPSPWNVLHGNWRGVGGGNGDGN